MGFWDSKSGDDPRQEGGSFEIGGGGEPIPANTQLKAAPDEVKWDSFNDDDFINIRWSVLAPEEYKGRKVFQKLRVLDTDEKKADKHKRMLASIDANAGGNLAKIDNVPSDQQLMSALLNKPMSIQVQVWEINDKKGNWVSAVAPASGGGQQPAPKNDDEKDDDIPW